MARILYFDDVTYFGGKLLNWIGFVVKSFQPAEDI